MKLRNLKGQNATRLEHWTFYQRLFPECPELVLWKHEVLPRRVAGFYALAWTSSFHFQYNTLSQKSSSSVISTKAHQAQDEPLCLTLCFFFLLVWRNILSRGHLKKMLRQPCSVLGTQTRTKRGKEDSRCTVAYFCHPDVTV